MYKYNKIIKKILLISLIFLSLLTSINIVNATSGALKEKSIKTCNGKTYGYHGSDNHWHEAKYTPRDRGSNYTAIGSPIYSDPCASQGSTNNKTKTPNSSNNNNQNNTSSNNQNNSQNNNNTNQNNSNSNTNNSNNFENSNTLPNESNSNDDNINQSNDNNIDIKAAVDDINKVMNNLTSIIGQTIKILQTRLMKITQIKY